MGSHKSRRSSSSRSSSRSRLRSKSVKRLANSITNKDKYIINDDKTIESIRKTINKNVNKISCKNIKGKLVDDKLLLNKLGSGSTGIALKMCDTKSCNNKLTIKFSKIDKSYTLGKGHPAFNEVKINKELNKLVNKNITPHINIIFNNIVCDWSILQNIKLKKLGEWTNVLSPSMFYGQSYDKVSVNFIDLGHMDFYTYIKTGIKYNEFMYLLFQLYYTLACIQYHHPGFKHNDLKCDNILVFKPKTTKTNYYHEYKIYGKTFYLPTDCMQLKIMDFDFTATDAIPNLKTEDSGFVKFGLSTSPNPVYDIHFFLNDLYRLVKENFKMSQLIDSVLPREFNGNDSDYLKRNRLSSYYKNNRQLTGKDFNYIPPKGSMLTPIEMILYGDTFADIKTVLIGSEKTVHSYNAKIKTIKGRKDMLHTYL
jgi:hypothetical protein